MQQRCHQSFVVRCQDREVSAQYLHTKAAVLLPHPIASGVTWGLSQGGNIAEGGPLANTQKKIEKW